MSRIQKVVDKLVNWGKLKGLTFNPEKTVVMLFTKKNIKPRQLPNKLIMNGKRVEFSTQTKYLGVTLDDKLLWSTHWKNVLKRAKQYLFMILPHVTKKWGPKPIYIKWIYTAIIRPRIMLSLIHI